MLNHRAVTVGLSALICSLGKSSTGSAAFAQRCERKGEGREEEKEAVVVTCGSTGRCIAGASDAAEFPLGWEYSERGGTGGCWGLVCAD